MAFTWKLTSFDLFLGAVTPLHTHFASRQIKLQRPVVLYWILELTCNHKLWILRLESSKPGLQG